MDKEQRASPKVCQIRECDKQQMFPFCVFEVQKEYLIFPFFSHEGGQSNRLLDVSLTQVDCAIHRGCWSDSGTGRAIEFVHSPVRRELLLYA